MNIVGDRYDKHTVPARKSEKSDLAKAKNMANSYWSYEN